VDAGVRNYTLKIINGENMVEIKVYGTGCARCKNLEQLCYDAVAEININANIEKVTDINEIVKTGILMTPGLEINGKIVSSGKIPTKETLIHWIQENIK
jgi:small redox-active disulfide protein 2